MKFLKLKSILFSLMAIAMVTVFLSSCEKDPISDSDLINNQTLGDENQKEIDLNIENLPSKEITLSDNLGNSVTLKVTTEDRELLALYSDKVFKADFTENEAENSFIDEVKNGDTSSSFHHDLSVERIKVFIEVSELSLRSNTSFSITNIGSAEITLRNSNIEKWYKAKYSKGLKVRCTGRGIDGLSAYGYHSTSNCNTVGGYFSSKYFYNQNSGSKIFTRKSGKCIWVRTVGSNNDRVTYHN